MCYNKFHLEKLGWLMTKKVEEIDIIPDIIMISEMYIIDKALLEKMADRFSSTNDELYINMFIKRAKNAPDIKVKELFLKLLEIIKKEDTIYLPIGTLIEQNKIALLKEIYMEVISLNSLNDNQYLDKINKEIVLETKRIVKDLYLSEKIDKFTTYCEYNNVNGLLLKDVDFDSQQQINFSLALNCLELLEIINNFKRFEKEEQVKKYSKSVCKI